MTITGSTVDPGPKRAVEPSDELWRGLREEGVVAATGSQPGSRE